MPTKHLSIRIDEQWLCKLRVVAEQENRTLNGQVYVLIRRCVEEYEKEHGKIPE